MAHSAVASQSVPRPTKPPRKGQPVRMHILLPDELVTLVDQFRDVLASEDDYFRSERPTRTEAVKVLLVEGLKKRGLKK